jgi:hypothetical protein
VRRADNLHVPIVLKSGSLNLLEPSGPVQACNGIALPLLHLLLLLPTLLQLMASLMTLSVAPTIQYAQKFVYEFYHATA